MTTESHEKGEDLGPVTSHHSMDGPPEKDSVLAQQATLAEHDLTVMQALRKYPKACMWSIFVSTAIIMEGYDVVLMGSFFAQPAFLERYADLIPGTDTYSLSAGWQAGLSNGSAVGLIIGAFANGFFTQKFGYRRVLLASLVFIAASIFVTFFAPSVEVLLVGQVLCGIPLGVFATMAPAYASEVCPMVLRGYLTVYVNLCWAIGQLIGTGVLQAFSEGTTQWAYRIPFAVQWVWPIPLFAILFFAPESPWHLVRMGKIDAAEKSIRRLATISATDAKQNVAMMIHTNELEKNLDAGTSYWDCFKGLDRRRTEIVCMAFAAQPFCGSAMGGTPTYFFVQAGLPTSISFKMTVGGLGLAAVGTIISWKLLHSFGRRTLYLYGLGGLTAILWIVGLISVGGKNTQGSMFAQASFMLLWLFVYYMTVGPICYAIISETSSTRLRNKSVCLSRIAYYIAQIFCNVINPYMLNPTQGDWKGKTGFFWGGCAFAFLVWTWFRLPEMKDRTYEELDILFAQKISARDFKKCNVNPYAATEANMVSKD